MRVETIAVSVDHVCRYGSNAALVLGFIRQSVGAQTGVWSTVDALADIVEGTGLPELVAHRAFATLRARRVVVSTAEGVRIDDALVGR